MPRREFFTLIIVFLLSIPASGQGIHKYEKYITCDQQREFLTYLADDLCQGRECGAEGGQEAARYILGKFRGWGMQPLRWKMVQSFQRNDTTIVRNIFAMVPAVEPSERYIIVSAHYDHIGTIKKTIYNGADDNASGVTVMLSLAEAFSRMRVDGFGPGKNIIFVAFDGHERNMCGSRWFAQHLDDFGIQAKQIDCVVNIDIIGTDLEPVGSNREYIICLGEETLPKKYHGLVKGYALFNSYSMDVDMTFYGSKNFTSYVYNSGDQYNFNKLKVPGVLFTSGFNSYTYKPTDDSNIINFELLKKRSLLIFNFVNSLCN